MTAELDWGCWQSERCDKSLDALTRRKGESSAFRNLDNFSLYKNSKIFINFTVTGLKNNNKNELCADMGKKKNIIENLYLN